MGKRAKGILHEANRKRVSLGRAYHIYINFINVGTAVLLEDFNSDLTIPISDSYWGTTDLEAIGNLITDNADDYTLGTVSVVNPVSALIDIGTD